MLQIVFKTRKGGVGKTTAAINAGAELARLGDRVLIIDTDPQGSVAAGLGLERRAGVSQWLGPALFGADSRIAPLVQFTQIAGLSVLTGNADTAALASALDNRKPARFWLRDLMAGDPIRSDLDVVIWDTPPHGDALTEQILGLADLVIAPARPDYLDLDGVNALIASVDGMEGREAPPVWILPNMVDFREGVSAEALGLIVANHPERLRYPNGQDAAPLLIPYRVAVRRALMLGEPVADIAPKDPSAQAFRDLAEQIRRFRPAREGGRNG